MKAILLCITCITCLLVACSQPAPTPTPIRHADVRRALPTAPRWPVAKPALIVPDLRNPSDLAQAACRAADGQWRCPKLVQRHLLAAAGNQPIIPSSWTIPNWYIDPANATTCASDSNSGTSATCSAGGVGPLKSYQELYVHRWGCLGTPSYCPRFRQNVTLTFLSSHTDNSDPVLGAFSLENGAQVLIQGQLTSAQRVCTGTITVNAAKNRTTGQVLEATLPCAVTAEDLIVNSTHASRAWTYSQV